MSHQDFVAHFRNARQNQQLAVLEGFHALKHAFRFGAEIEIIATADKAKLFELAKGLAPDVSAKLQAAQEVPTAVFDQLAPVVHPTGVIAIAKKCQPDITALLAVQRTAPLVVLENAQRLSNIGAAIRVSAAAGASGLIVVGDMDPWHPDAIRGAAGLQYALPVSRVDVLPEHNGPLLAIDPEGTELHATSLPSNAVLVFGTERGGISDALLSRADQRIRIPMQPKVSSLNLATSVAVILYTWRLSHKSY